MGVSTKWTRAPITKCVVASFGLIPECDQSIGLDDSESYGKDAMYVDGAVYSGSGKRHYIHYGGVYTSDSQAGLFGTLVCTGTNTNLGVFLSCKPSPLPSA